jgi:hypothetical protein
VRLRVQIFCVYLPNLTRICKIHANSYYLSVVVINGAAPPPQIYLKIEILESRLAEYLDLDSMISVDRDI